MFTLVLRCHDEQLVADLDPLPGIWIERPLVSNDQGHHSVPGKPKLGHFDTGELRLGRDPNLQQISRDPVEWRNPTSTSMRVSSRQARVAELKRGSVGTLQAGEDDDEDQHDIEENPGTCDFLRQRNGGQHDRHRSAEPRQ